MPMNAKSEALRIIQSLPESASMEDIQYHLYVREKIEKGLADVAAGRVVSHEEVKRQVEEWKSAGPKQP
jgi:predicted transcriptional regulator